MSYAYVALGANLGDRLGTIEAAMARLAEIGKLDAISSVYETDPIGYLDQPAYLNAAVGLETNLPPERLMEALLSIERDFGRVRTFANAPRVIDLDLLLYDGEQITTKELEVPHPRMHERAFVLVPLAEIAPDAAVPGRNATVAELLGRLGAVTGIAVYSPPPAGSPSVSETQPPRS